MKPDCYVCAHRRNVPGDEHSACANIRANVRGDANGIKSGRFIWPFIFDPAWLISCDGFKSIQNSAEQGVNNENSSPA